MVRSYSDSAKLSALALEGWQARTTYNDIALSARYMGRVLYPQEDTRIYVNGKQIPVDQSFNICSGKFVAEPTAQAFRIRYKLDGKSLLVAPFSLIAQQLYRILVPNFATQQNFFDSTIQQDTVLASSRNGRFETQQVLRRQLFAADGSPLDMRAFAALHGYVRSHTTKRTDFIAALIPGNPAEVYENPKWITNDVEIDPITARVVSDVRRVKSHRQTKVKNKEPVVQIDGQKYTGEIVLELTGKEYSNIRRTRHVIRKTKCLPPLDVEKTSFTAQKAHFMGVNPNIARDNGSYTTDYEGGAFERLVDAEFNRIAINDQLPGDVSIKDIILANRTIESTLDVDYTGTVEDVQLPLHPNFGTPLKFDE